MSISKSLNSLFALFLALTVGSIAFANRFIESEVYIPMFFGIVGAVGGGLLGSLIGGGTGRDVAIAVGAIGGGLAGHQVQKKYDTQPGSAITVRLDSGVLVEVTQPVDPDLKVGDKVMVQGQGESARVTRT